MSVTVRTENEIDCSVYGLVVVQCCVVLGFFLYRSRERTLDTREEPSFAGLLQVTGRFVLSARIAGTFFLPLGTGSGILGYLSAGLLHSAFAEHRY